MHIEAGNKFKVKEKLGSFCDVGEIIKVTEMNTNGMVTFIFDDCGEDSAVFKRTGSMDTTTFEKYFEEIKEEVVEETEESSIVEEEIYEILDNSKFDVYTVFDKCTVVSCQLPNGFVITESSSCVDPKNYDEELGFEICYDKIFNKVCEFEAYRLQQELYEENGYPYDGEVDCENCDDYDCPENPHYCS